MTKKTLVIISDYVDDIICDYEYVDIVVVTRSGKEYHVDKTSAKYFRDCIKEEAISIFGDYDSTYIDINEVESIKVIRN